MKTTIASKPIIPPERAVRNLADDGLGLMQKVAGGAEDQLHVGRAYLRAIADHVYTPASGVAKIALAVSEDYRITPKVRLEAAVKAMLQTAMGLSGPAGQAASKFASDLIMNGFLTQADALTDAARDQAQQDIHHVTSAAIGVLAASDDRIRARVAQAALATVGSEDTKWAAQASAIETARHMGDNDSLTTTLRAGARQAFAFGHGYGKSLALEPFLEAIPTRWQGGTA